MRKFTRHVEGAVLHGESQWWANIGGMTFDFFEGRLDIEVRVGSDSLGSYKTMRAAVLAAKRFAAGADGGGATPGEEAT